MKNKNFRERLKLCKILKCHHLGAHELFITPTDDDDMEKYQVLWKFSIKIPIFIFQLPSAENLRKSKNIFTTFKLEIDHCPLFHYRNMRNLIYVYAKYQLLCEYINPRK